MLLIALVTDLAAAGEPAERTCAASGLELAATISDAQRALEQLDSGRFVAATDKLDALLPCLAEPLTPHLAAEIHRTKGIRAVSERDPDASRSFAAARALEPAYTFPSSLVPEGHPVRTAYAGFDLSTGGYAALPPPTEGTLSLDGSDRLFRPTAWPTIVQHRHGDGSIDFTAYVRAGEDLPAYVPAPEPSVVPAPGPAPAPMPAPIPPEPVARSGHPRVPLAIAALGSAALTGTTLALAGRASARFADLETPDEELDGLRAQANALVVVSGFTGAATAGFAIGAVAVGGR